MAIRRWIRKLFATDLKYYNSNCKTCGHGWMMHSFYGITRSECHEDECECGYYEQKGYMK